MANDDEVQRIIKEALSELGPTDVQALAQRLASAGMPSVEQVLAATKPPSCRRPRRGEPVTLRVRVDLVGTTPPVWRRLELASDLFLDEVHEIIQAAFGWTDSHLHQFGCGPHYYSRETEYYLCPFSVADGDAEGVPEEEVRLDEVLVDVGDKLFYTYDFGDDWQHVIRLEAVLDRYESTPRSICTGGRRPAPAEDCGGIGGYALLAAATDPAHPDHAAVLAEYAELYGPDADPYGWAPKPFDVDVVNGVLADLGAIASRHEIPSPLRDLLDAMRIMDGRHRLRRLLGSARLGDPVLIGADTAAAAVRPYAWLLERVGDDGIKLTQAGYLPPVHVAAAFTELGFDDVWIGAGNREDLTYPVLDLRRSAQRIGLLRKRRGWLVATARGRALRTDPVGLWWHLAERTPVASSNRCVHQAGLLYLAAVAAGIAGDHERIVAELLGALGWMRGDGSPITAASAAAVTSEVAATLRRMGLLRRGGSALDQPERPTRTAVEFARAALTAWPR
ncbi:plasmid pRiA4b ORF-3 family protein [Mycobacterium sp. SM1]|uniref:plasmid pRiA4b ORF-3 family protein n=1 Tax=Mycobacterium sp. SM1 TaxID=2816243 RepID=UPI001BD13BAC|nr:plasmid pRiA4b ORF-3 family protein [Mycobacterium sp. SM1]MBS4729748.1 plasmid pRiA4b ORF-3 family protein [Mycobacterium sp. SM1]